MVPDMVPDMVPGQYPAVPGDEGSSSGTAKPTIGPQSGPVPPILPSLEVPVRPLFPAAAEAATPDAAAEKLGAEKSDIPALKLPSNESRYAVPKNSSEKMK